MQRVEPVARRQRFPKRLDLRGVVFRSCQTEPLTDSLDMSINREGRLVETKKQHDRCRLVADAIETGQPGQPVFHRQFGQEGDVERAAFVEDASQRSLDARRLGRPHPGGANDLGQLVQRCVQHCLPVATVGRLELLEGASAVDVRSVGAEHCQHQFVHRLEIRSPVGMSVLLLQKVVDSGCFFFERLGHIRQSLFVVGASAPFRIRNDAEAPTTNCQTRNPAAISSPPAISTPTSVKPKRLTFGTGRDAV